MGMSRLYDVKTANLSKTGKDLELEETKITNPYWYLPS